MSEDMKYCSANKVQHFSKILPHFSKNPQPKKTNKLHIIHCKKHFKNYYHIKLVEHGFNVNFTMCNRGPGDNCVILNGIPTLNVIEIFLELKDSFNCETCGDEEKPLNDHYFIFCEENAMVELEKMTFRNISIAELYRSMNFYDISTLELTTETEHHPLLKKAILKQFNSSIYGNIKADNILDLLFQIEIKLLSIFNEQYYPVSPFRHHNPDKRLQFMYFVSHGYNPLAMKFRIQCYKVVACGFSKQLHRLPYEKTEQLIDNIKKSEPFSIQFSNMKSWYKNFIEENELTE